MVSLPPKVKGEGLQEIFILKLPNPPKIHLWFMHFSLYMLQFDKVIKNDRENTVKF